MPSIRFLLFVLTLVVMSILKWAAFYSREKETDESGNPILKFIGCQIVMALLGLFVLGFGIYEWLDPFNHRYSGNIFMLSYIPIAISLFVFLFAGYCWRYRVTLANNNIEIQRWPFRALNYKIDEIQSLQQVNRQTLLHFRNKDFLRVTPMLSGWKFFLQTIEQIRRPND